MNIYDSFLAKVMTMRSKVLVVMIATVFFAKTADAEIILPLDLQPGDQYQLIFVTAGTRDATSGKAADYNQFVTTQAAQNFALPSTTWHAVLSTQSNPGTRFINARDNAVTYKSIPIYNTAGLRVADGTADFWDGSLQHAINYDQFGSPHSAFVITATETNGYSFGGLSDYSSGPSSIRIGKSSYSDERWIYSGIGGARFPGSIYALSTPLTVDVVPEPSTLTIWALFCMVGGFVAWRKRKH